MYTVTTEQSFDAAHFLKGYDGKCKNLHGHRWRVIVEAGAEDLNEGGMVVDFTDLKRDLKRLADELDHSLIMETDSLRQATYQALLEEGFRIEEVPFRPTAEHFARYFYERMKEQGHTLCCVRVYETPGNCAAYTPSDEKGKQ